MTNLGDIFHYLEMQVNHVIDEKFTFCQSTYLKKTPDRFKMTKCQSASILIDLGVANFLLLYHGNANKEIIK